MAIPNKYVTEIPRFKARVLEVLKAEVGRSDTYPNKSLPMYLPMESNDISLERAMFLHTKMANFAQRKLGSFWFLQTNEVFLLLDNEVLLLLG